MHKVSWLKYNVENKYFKISLLLKASLVCVCHRTWVILGAHLKYQAQQNVIKWINRDNFISSDLLEMVGGVDSSVDLS